MLNSIFKITKPEYLIRPKQIIFRVVRNLFLTKQGFKIVKLPWGCKIKIRVNDDIGSAIWYLGVYELVVSEVLWRFTNPGDIAADIGANIGHMTSLFAVRVGTKGKVYAFEPHPRIFNELEYNTSVWQTKGNFGRIELFNCALSDKKGFAKLFISEIFEKNCGIASLSKKTSSSYCNSISVDTKRLMDLFHDAATCPNILKIDVEGAEELVLRGAETLLIGKKIRDILFEDYGEYPTPTMLMLESFGYTVFKIKRTFWGPKLLPANFTNDKSYWEPPNYLATLDKTRALSIMKIPGWSCLFGNKS